MQTTTETGRASVSGWDHFARRTRSRVGTDRALATQDSTYAPGFEPLDESLSSGSTAVTLDVEAIPPRPPSSVTALSLRSFLPVAESYSASEYPRASASGVFPLPRGAGV